MAASRTAACGCTANREQAGGTTFCTEHTLPVWPSVHNAQPTDSMRFNKRRHDRQPPPSPLPRAASATDPDASLRKKIQEFAFQPRFDKSLDLALGQFFGKEAVRKRQIVADEGETAVRRRRFAQRRNLGDSRPYSLARDAAMEYDIGATHLHGSTPFQRRCRGVASYQKTSRRRLQPPTIG